MKYNTLPHAKFNVRIHFQWEKEMVTDWKKVHIREELSAHEDFLETLFRQQNRVEPNDVLLFDNFPSLTAGDMVSLHRDGETAKHYYCDSVGWRELTEEEQQRWLDCEDPYDRSPFGFNKIHPAT